MVIVVVVVVVVVVAAVAAAVVAATGLPSASGRSTAVEVTAYCILHAFRHL